MTFVTAATLLGCMYPSVFFAKADCAGAAGDAIQVEELATPMQEILTAVDVEASITQDQVPTGSVVSNIELNRVNKSQTFIPSNILELCISHLDLIIFPERIGGKEEESQESRISQIWCQKLEIIKIYEHINDHQHL
jgi:hypothetical protein